MAIFRAKAGFYRKTKAEISDQSYDQEIFAIPGIYSNNRNPLNNELIYFYSILTTEANELMR
ncbi:hypothetical protein GCM10007103_11290 [Salinimicrobium marinum]|uniref:Uncharacterized protein n=1 Tax=Salinimicrobium marinum TaxID=680283 RepID=A0A918SBN2_9FLAO|nr:hypothetical protein GCM10007103_11290 [Salinimicrobium marinum]